MEIMSRAFDNRINSSNLYVETTFREYLSFAQKIISNNDLQRKRVNASKTVYSLLKSDLKKGCIMPPLVLAVTGSNMIDSQGITEIELLEYIQKNHDKVLILDGLQRTYTLIDAEAEMREGDGLKYEKFLEYKLRLEVYLEINKFGVLYRMLTLNTGQTPMSARHQLEMLYRDLLNVEIEGIRLVTDIEGNANPDDNEFIFKNVIDGFNSYMNRNELPLDRQELLENIKILENMSDENMSNDIFREFLSVYAKIFNSLNEISDKYIVTESDLEDYLIGESPFAKKVSKAFSTSQALTGFGAAIGKMKDKEIIDSMDDIVNCIVELEEKNNGYFWFLELLKKLDIIKNNSKKIGNAQRMFFQYFFRELFNDESDSFLDLSLAVENGYNKYYSQVS
ncbi:MAG: hypothetical protein J6A77_12585 [Lachnospiraceae bacterium]|nr:hypothetical protein [Lachnospiraceae bacterium]